MLCAKCRQKEATIHFTTVVDGAEKETVHLCEDCAPPTGFNFDKLDLKEMEALSVIGKKCEFCGGDAFSGLITSKGGAIYWCFDCGLEFGRVFSDLLVSQRPDLFQRSKEESSFLSFCADPGLQEWSETASRKAVQTLKERRRQDGRDEGS
jgi:hypothetical protein